MYWLDELKEALGFLLLFCVLIVYVAFYKIYQNFKEAVKKGEK